MCAAFHADDLLDAAEAAGGVASFVFDGVESSWVTSAGFGALMALAPGVPLGSRAGVTQRVHPDDLGAVLRAPDETSTAAPNYIVTYRVLLADGAVRRIRERGTVQRDAAGTITRITGAIADISDMPRQALEPDSLADRFARAMRGTLEGLWEVDFVTEVTWFDPRFSALLGYEHEEFRWGPASSRAWCIRTICPRS